MSVGVFDLGMVQRADLHKRITAQIKRRRGEGDIAIYVEKRFLTSDTLLHLAINGKKAVREVSSMESVGRAVNDMIDELWPLELLEVHA